MFLFNEDLCFGKDLWWLIEDICFRRDFCLVKELDLFLCNKLYFNLDLELCLDEDVRLVNALCLYLGADLSLDLCANVMWFKLPPVIGGLLLTVGSNGADIADVDVLFANVDVFFVDVLFANVDVFFVDVLFFCGCCASAGSDSVAGDSYVVSSSNVDMDVFSGVVMFAPGDENVDVFAFGDKLVVSVYVLFSADSGSDDSDGSDDSGSGGSGSGGSGGDDSGGGGVDSGGSVGVYSGGGVDSGVPLEEYILSFWALETGKLVESWFILELDIGFCFILNVAKGSIGPS